MRVIRKCVSAGLTLGVVTLIAACGSTSSSSSSSGGGAAASSSGSSSKASAGPITIGTSLSLSGDFSADGQAFERGYQLWAADQNKAGGLLGHPIKLDVLSDSSSPAQVVSNYQKLIGSNKDALVFGPFSSLLTVPAARIAQRYGYAFVEGAGGAPSVFGAGLHNVFDVSIPIKNNLVTFAQWVASLPAAKRPKTAAYVTVNDPFTQPQLPVAQKILEAAGVKTVLNKVFPEEVTDYTAIAGQVATAKPDVVLLGSVDVPTVSAFTHVFVQQHFVPKAFIATAGPDQGAQFVKAVGAGNEDGIFVPNGWFGGFKKADSQKMVQEYIAKYGGTASDVNADVAENTAQKTLTFQWQNGKLVQTIPTATAGATAPLYPKPAWK
jgi:branched-chain amino acid transport system substrate-binding protein